MHSLAERPTEAAVQGAPRADLQERNREAWNLPRTPGEGVSHGPYRDALDWDGFRDLYYPDSRRHNLAAIVAYGAHKKSSPAGQQPASEATHPKRAAISTEAVSLEQWEDEGGMPN
jgi:hypothetical protein